MQQSATNIVRMSDLSSYNLYSFKFEDDQGKEVKKFWITNSLDRAMTQCDVPKGIKMHLLIVPVKPVFELVNGDSVIQFNFHLGDNGLLNCEVTIHSLDPEDGFAPMQFVSRTLFGVGNLDELFDLFCRPI